MLGSVALRNKVLDAIAQANADWDAAYHTASPAERKRWDVLLQHLVSAGEITSGWPLSETKYYPWSPEGGD